MGFMLHLSRETHSTRPTTTIIREYINLEGRLPRGPNINKHTRIGQTMRAEQVSDRHPEIPHFTFSSLLCSYKDILPYTDKL